MFIYLNRTGYNGLFRLNAGGEFNVPAGRYAGPRICDEANLRRVAAALCGSLACEWSTSVSIASLDERERGDFVYSTLRMRR